MTYSDVQGGFTGTGNINANPLFVTGSDGDYYLSQIAAGQAADSPCVDAGSDTAANLGMSLKTTRTDSLCDAGILDMGYHYTPITGSADIDENWHVDFYDFAILAAEWLECSDTEDPNCTESGLLAGDIFPDYYVNIYDLAVLSDNWLNCLVGSASNPNPADGATAVDPNAFLNWTAGDGALGHDVYLGADANAVADADYLSGEYMGTVSDVNFDPCGLDLDTTYFWRIDETGLRCTTKGDVWHFTTQEEMDSNLVSWWKFDEGGGTTAYDSAGSNDGSIIGNPVWTAGRINGALDFDGTGDYIDVGNNSSLGADAFTISAWVYREQSGKTQTIVDKSRLTSSYGGYALLTDASDKVEVVLCDGAAPSPAFVTSNSFPASTWVHVAATSNGGTISTGDVKVYFNAVEQTGAENNYGTSLKSNTRDVYIGAYDASTGTTGKWNGMIDDVRIYNRALSAGEIWQIYEDGL